MPDLMRMYAPKGKQPVIKFFEGPGGIAMVFQDFATSLKPGSPYYRYSSRGWNDRKSMYVPKNYAALMKGKYENSKGYIISNKNVADARQKNVLHPNQYWKVIPKALDPFGYNITQRIYEGKVSFIDYNSNSAFIIENKKFAEFQKSIFMLFWDRLPNFEDEED